MSWYESGYDGINKEEARIEAAQTPDRVWIPAGQNKEMVLIDDTPICIYEHNAKINNNWRNHHTCALGMYEDCPSCTQLGEKSRYYVGYLTCVDCSLYTDRKGNKYQYGLKLIGAKVGTLKKWKRKKEDFGSLAMTRFRVHRDSDKDPATGGEFERLSEVKDNAKLFELVNYRGKKLKDLFDQAEADPEFMTRLSRIFQLTKEEGGKLVRVVPAFNYEEVLKPRPPAAIKALLRGVTVTSDVASAGTDAADDYAEDEIPF